VYLFHHEALNLDCCALLPTSLFLSNLTDLVICDLTEEILASSSIEDAEAIRCPADGEGIDLFKESMASTSTLGTLSERK